ncbi:hypothetical protein LIER_37501 [Lithospermum erythrorhizon]|uniref:Uncharacterized protein n=1 Tax=Lithospermum erythrorhizon TaxID=34254 RepID=A0AAV3PL84_LITER
MAKRNQSNKTSQNVCQKLKNAINFTPFRRFHGVSSQQSHSAPTPTPPPQTTNNPIKVYISQPSSGKFIPIATAAQGGGEHLIKPKVDKVPKEMRTHDINNGDNGRFSEYITRVRDGMRTSSDLGIERIPTRKISRRDSLNDRVSNFLNRAKIKNRTIMSNNVGHDVHGNEKMIIID